MNANGSYSGETTRCFYLELSTINVTQTVFIGAIFTCIVNFSTAMTACFGNLLLIVAILTNSNLHSNGNYILSSLATVDFFVGCFLQPLHAVYQIQFVLGKRSCSVAVAYQTLKLVLVMSSLLNALMVSCERCLAILLPTRYHAVVKMWKLFLLMGKFILVWAAVVFLQFAGTITYGSVQLIASSIIIIAITVVIIFYILMMKVAHRHRIQIVAQHKASGRRNSLRKESRVFKMAVFVIGAFLLCYLPVSIAWILDVTRNLKPQRSFLVLIYTESLVYVNSTLNIWIYGWRNGEIRQAIYRIVRWKRLRRLHPSDPNSYAVKSTTATITTLTNTS